MKQKHLFFSLLCLVLCTVFVSFLSAEGQREVSREQVDTNVIQVTDARGKEIEVELPVGRIATFPVPHPHIIISIDGDSERIIGMHPLAKSAAKVSILGNIAPELLEVETDFLSGSKLNVEELARVNPDVFFTDKVLEGMENIEELGFPVIYLGLIKDRIPLSTEEGDNQQTLEVFSPKATMKDWVEITAEVLEKPRGIATKVIDNWNNTEEAIRENISGLSASERPKVLILFKTKAMMVAGKGSFGDYWINSVGAKNVAAQIKTEHPAMVKIGNFEEILKWDPDFVFITNFDETNPEEIYNNAISGQDWSEVSAVRKKQVYKIPLGIYRWYPPSLDGPLMLKWMALTLYPDLFDFDMREEILYHFSNFYNYTPSDEEIDAVLSPEASGTY